MTTSIAREHGVLPATLRIMNMVRGKVYGFAYVSDREMLGFPRILNGESAWEVTAQLANGTQVIRYTLMACANDVRSDNGMIPGFAFRFVPEENVTADIQPPAPETIVTEVIPSVPVPPANQLSCTTRSAGKQGTCSRKGCTCCF
jgi:hypothetical protein